MTQPALTRRFRAAASLPRIDLVGRPTDVEHAEALGESVGIPNLFVKRDDATGELYGGNKVRKLEFLLADALEAGHERVWTVGGIGSHHVLATSIYARQQGLEPGALQFPQPVTDHVLDNLRALSTTRPDLTLVESQAQIPVEVLRTRVREWLARGPEVYYIPGGGSSPVGAVGFVDATLELADQIAAGEVPEPDVIAVAAGTCGTVSGIRVGCHLAGIDPTILAVRVVDRKITNRAKIRSLVDQTAARLREFGVPTDQSIGLENLELVHDYFGDEYGVPTQAGTEAIDVASDRADLQLDPTYTGKAFAALVGERHRLALADKDVLYWHTLNGVDLGDRIESADVAADLPPEYARFFDRQDAN